MATSDGISSEDWDLVHELAQEIVTNSMNEDEPAREDARKRMLDCLRSLQSKYGSLPSILATSADYVDDLAEREELLLRAWNLTKDRIDRVNAQEIAHSLAELYVQEMKNRTLGTLWLDVLKEEVSEPDDAWLRAEIERLQKLL
jgi:hypothetical protein